MHKVKYFGRQASGCILMSRSSGRLLLVRRSAVVDQPHCWANIGGAHCSDEEPEDAALREVCEETGYSGDLEMIPLFVFVDGTFRYNNFLAIIDEEFDPKLNWEANDAIWIEHDAWPAPLHFGLTALLADEKSIQTIEHYSRRFKSK